MDPLLVSRTTSSAKTSALRRNRILKSLSEKEMTITKSWGCWALLLAWPGSQRNKMKWLNWIEVGGVSSWFTLFSLRMQYSKERGMWYSLSQPANLCLHRWSVLLWGEKKARKRSYKQNEKKWVKTLTRLMPKKSVNFSVQPANIHKQQLKVIV